MTGPAFVIALRNALERRPDPEYKTPPRTGGTQISIRLDEFVYNHVEAIVARSGWNRAEVLHALIQRGLFDLYEFCTPEVVNAIVGDVVGKLAPPHPPSPLSDDDMMEKCADYLVELSEYEARTDAQIDSAVDMFLIRSKINPFGLAAQRKELAESFARKARRSEASEHIRNRILRQHI
jgi:hypothetical protein